LRTGYELAKRGRYPCAVLRLGNAYRVVTADLLKLMPIDVSESAGDEEPAAVALAAETDRLSLGCCCCCACRCARRCDAALAGVTL